MVRDAGRFDADLVYVALTMPMPFVQSTSNSSFLCSDRRCSSNNYRCSLPLQEEEEEAEEDEAEEDEAEEDEEEEEEGGEGEDAGTVHVADYHQEGRVVVCLRI